MTLRRVFAATAITALAGLGATACGGDDGIDTSSATSERTETTSPEPESRSGETASEPLQRLRLAGEKTSEQVSAAVDVTIDIDVDGETIGVVMDGTSDLASGSGDFTMALEGPGISSDLRIVTDSATVWVTQDDSTWYEIDADEFETGGAPTNLDATGYLAFLEQVGEVSEVGDEQIDGVDTTHYRADVDLADFAELQGSSVDAAALEEAGIDSLPLDVYIDGDDYVRRVTLSMAADVEGTSFSMDVAANFSDFGASAEIETPPAGDIQPGSAATLGELSSGS